MIVIKWLQWHLQESSNKFFWICFTRNLQHIHFKEKNSLTPINTTDEEPGPGQLLARRINRRAQALLAHGIATKIH
jgi:hypothetical protein